MLEPRDHIFSCTCICKSGAGEIGIKNPICSAIRPARNNFFLNDAKTDDSHIGIYNYVLCKLSCIPTHVLSMKYFIRAPICGRPIVINLFVRPFVRQSICPLDHLSGAYPLSLWPSLAVTSHTNIVFG